MTMSEREKKVNTLKLELAMMDVNFFYPDDFKVGSNNYINKGIDFRAEYPMPQYDRCLIVELFNDKRKQSQFILRHMSNMKSPDKQMDVDAQEEYPGEPVLEQ